MSGKKGFWASMNLPNRLTLLRMLLAPVYLVLMWISTFASPVSFCVLFRWIALLVFAAASLTDLFDGQIARRRGLVTNFGKFMDPLADKLLVCSAMICLIEWGSLPSWIVIVIIAREFIISGFRLIAAEKGRVIAAGQLGKIKTVLQMIMVILMIMDIDALYLPTRIFMWGALIMTVVSLVDYLFRNRDIMSGEM